MDLETLKREGWFDDDEVLDFTLNADELRRLRNKEQITGSQLGSSYTIELSPTRDPKHPKQEDMIIKKVSFRLFLSDPLYFQILI